MALLNKDAILQAEDRAHEDIAVPEWGGEVRIQALSGTERDAYEASFVRLDARGKQIGRDLKNTRARLLALCIVGSDGKRQFTDADVRALGAKNGAVLDRLFDAAKRLSGLHERSVEAAEGNSGTAPSGGSTSD
ncbi:hypothetical protein [Streptomyces sp. NPDC049881]|uniref:hypothetical protein n=1 Tax=Streptomyces sp. NPDC049881 TaxID=3155778 RepID=UPI00342B8A19